MVHCPYSRKGEFMKTGGQVKQGGTGLAPNIASMLCYVCSPVSSIIFLLLEKENKDVRFHAWQGTLFGAAIIVLHVALNILGYLFGHVAGFLEGIFIGFLIPVLWIAFFVLWVVCLFKAYQGERWKIPVLGDIAAQKAGV